MLWAATRDAQGGQAGIEIRGDALVDIAYGPAQRVFTIFPVD